MLHTDTTISVVVIFICNTRRDPCVAAQTILGGQVQVHTLVDNTFKIASVVGRYGVFGNPGSAGVDLVVVLD